MKTLNHDKLKEEVHIIAKEHIESDSAIEKVLWFPSEKELRIIDVFKKYPNSETQEELDVFQFDYEIDGEKIPLLIGSVSKDQLQKMNSPRQDWGQWSDAEEIV